MNIAIDFDGTIVEHEYPEIGREKPFAIETLKLLQKENHRLILWTVREGELLDEAVEYCRNRGLEFYAVNCNNPEETTDSPTYSRKLQVDLFVDDRNLGGVPDWGVIYQMIKSGNVFTPTESDPTTQRSTVGGRKNFFLRIGEALEKRTGQ